MGILVGIPCFLFRRILGGLLDAQREPIEHSTPGSGERLRTTKAEARMVALGIEPVLVDVSVAAAMCGMTPERFASQCPLGWIEEGRRRLIHLESVRSWAKKRWSKKTRAPTAHDEDRDDAAFLLARALA